MPIGRLVAVAFAIALAACAPQVRPPASRAVAPEGFPAQLYREAAAHGDAIYAIDPRSSLVVIEVRRAGALARLGHDHVVASRDIEGFIWPGAGRADLYAPLDRLTVDEPALRAEAHFDTHPSPEDIAGTRRNMLTRVLDTERYPFVRIHVEGPVSGDPPTRVDVEVTLHGTTRSVSMPIELLVRSTGIDASGRLALRQNDFGIEPLSILGGAIQVQDEISLRFRLHAIRMQ
ncbi:MAG TPA: YceI family protein [Casimicrobiaceae bacterium]|nr:YceI family protein [Casimicrobiaceae bacterium]